MQLLQCQEATGACALWYFDVSGFCLTPYIPYAWQPMGSVITIPASTHRRRLNVLGFLNRHNELFPYMIEGKVDTSVIVECFDQFSKQIKKRTYVFLDNSPLHRSHESPQITRVHLSYTAVGKKRLNY
jgi:DDE superfamily endonuclease